MIPRYAREQMVSNLVARDQIPHLVRDRGPCHRRAGRAGRGAERGRRQSLGKGPDAKFDVARIDEIEREVKHDVIAFLTHLSEIVGPEARFVHQGMTSSDVLDTCLNVQLARAADHFDRRHRCAAGGAEEARLRIQDDAHHRAQPWHPCRAHHLRRQAGDLLCRIHPRARAAGDGAGGNRHLRHFRRGRHFRQYRSRAWKNMSPRRWVWRSSRFRPR